MADKNTNILDYFLPSLGVGTDILNSIFGRNSQDESNRINLQIARENNEFNERMLERQIAYNTEMWNKQNEYNDPAAQAQRLRDAGFSPLRFMGQGGQAGSAQGITTPTATPAHVEPKRLDLSGLSQRLLSMQQMNHENNMAQAQTELTREDIVQRKIENSFRRKQLIAELNEKIVNTKNVELRNVYQNLLNSFEQDTQGIRKQILENENQLTQNNANLSFINGLIQKKVLGHMDEQHAMAMANGLTDIQNKFADIAVKYSTVELNKANKAKIFQEVRNLVEQFNGLVIDNGMKALNFETMEKTMEFNVRQAFLNSLPKNATERFYLSRHEGKDWYPNVLTDTSEHKGINNHVKGYMRATDAIYMLILENLPSLIKLGK